MSTLSIQPTYPIFTDIDGQPLENGYVWIGTANLDPQVNPINVYWDAALTLPAAQPIRTLAGYPANSGTPARLYVNSDYSIRVMNRNGSVVYSAPAATERYNEVVLGGLNASDVVYDPAGTGAVATTVQAKLRETVSVKDFGAVGDGITDNTAAYAAMIAALPEGSVIEWPTGSYKGDFVSTKSFTLIGNGSTLIGAGNFAIIEMQGSLGSYASLSAAPAYGDTSLTGVTGLTADTIVLLYSGNTRPSDGSPVNYEVVKIKSDGTVYDMVYSDQTGGTPRYAVVTPIKNVRVSGFKFAGGVDAVNGVFIRYAENVIVDDIYMDGGSINTVAVRSAINVAVSNVTRIKPSATGSGQGYNVALNITKTAFVTNVYGEAARHDVDLDSCYLTNISNVQSNNCVSQPILLTHNGYGGFASVRNVAASSTEFVIGTSAAGITPTSLLFRQAVIENIKISNDVSMTVNTSYVGIYFQYPTENIAIRDVFVTNTNNPNSFDYAAGTYNPNYFVIRAYRPDKNFLVDGLEIDSAAAAVFVDNISGDDIDSGGLTVRNVAINYFVAIIDINQVLGAARGNVSLSDVKFYDASGNYGKAIVWVRELTDGLRSLMIYNLKTLPFYAKTVELAANVDVPVYSNIDIAGFTRANSTLNALASGGTITQHEYLSRGDFAIWTSTTKTLSTTTPIERPVTSGNIFAIFNGGAGTLTIPGGSNTVSNVAAINIAPGEMYYFQANGNKWSCYRKQTGNTLP